MSRDGLIEIPKGALTSLLREGRLTLQIPQVVIDAGAEPTPKEDLLEKIPAKWVCQLKSDKTPCIGRQQGFLYLTKMGWEHNKEALFEAFVEGYPKRHGDHLGEIDLRDMLERHVEQHFEAIEMQKNKQIDKRIQEIRELNGFNV